MCSCPWSGAGPGGRHTWTEGLRRTEFERYGDCGGVIRSSQVMGYEGGMFSGHAKRLEALYKVTRRFDL